MTGVGALGSWLWIQSLFSWWLTWTASGLSASDIQQAEGGRSSVCFPFGIPWNLPKSFGKSQCILSEIREMKGKEWFRLGSGIQGEGYPPGPGAEWENPERE